MRNSQKYLEGSAPRKMGVGKMLSARDVQAPMALLGLSELQLRLLASACLCRVDFAGSKWLLVACHSWSSRGDFQNLLDTQVLSQGRGAGGSRERG